jgi:antitoxin component HigA of HigAB toxin-antitoxin module
MKKPFAKIRSKMDEYEIGQIELAEMLGMSLSYISSRLTNKKPWDMRDAYKLMDLFKIPYEQMHEYFPKDGKTYNPAIKKQDGFKLKRVI